MTVVAQPLIESTAVPTTDTTMYTASAATRVYLDTITATNTTGAALTININLVPSAGTAGSTNLITPTKSIAANDSYTFPEVRGHALGPGGFLSAKASGAGINLRISGRVMT